MQAEQSSQINFGQNQAWRSLCYRPRHEDDVRKILEQHRAGKLRCFGAKHSWSEIAVCTDASVDLSLFDQIELVERDGARLVRVGAGCTLQRLLDWLHARTDQTLPTVGVIKRQTVAGAISTATHGSGKPSLSHFVEEVRLAAYDAAGQPAIFVYQSGDELKASRCALGCMGILLRVVLRTVPKYHVEEHVRLHRSLGEVLREYDRHALTQFTYTPYRWDFLAFQRTPLQGRTLTAWQKLVALFYRGYVAVVVDRAIHLGVWLAIRLGNKVVKAALKSAPALLRVIHRIDEAEHVLTQRHDRFRHEEMELFVPQSRLEEAVAILRCATEQFAGEDAPVSDEMRKRLGTLHGELMRQRGTYTHHYAFFFRKVLPEQNTLISMTASSSEALFSISVFTYFPAGKRAAYYAFCDWLARSMYALVDARLHWGKHFPLSAVDMAGRCPELGRFRKLCTATDPRGVFRNPYVVRVLGFH